MDIESGSQGRAGGAAGRKSKMPLLKFPLPGKDQGGRVHAVEVSGARGVCRGLGPGQAGPTGFQGPL